MSPAFLLHELQVAQHLAREAGAVAMRHHGRQITIETKPEGDPVTIADREANELIVSGLELEFPSDAILAEETPDDGSRKTKERVWMVDPIDGTNDFIRQRDGFAVMIGLTIESRPVLGVVFQPIGQRLYWASQDSGAWLAIGDAPPRALAVSRAAPSSSIRLVASKSHRSPFIDEVRKTLAISDEQNVGSVGLKLGLIAADERDLYINPSSKSNVWDTCGPECILSEAGGKLTDLSGRPLPYDRDDVRNTNGLVASNGLLHEWVLEKIQPLLAKR